MIFAVHWRALFTGKKSTDGGGEQVLFGFPEKDCDP